MVTKGIITSIDFNGNTCQVRIPLFETTGNDPITGTAIVSNTPGSYNGYKVGDVVLVAFEDGKMQNPVIIGKLYLGAAKEKQDPRGTINVETTTASKSASLPADAVLTAKIDSNVPNTNVPFGSLASIANNLNSLNTDVNQLDRFTRNQFNSVITDVNDQGEQIRSEIKQTAENIENKVVHKHKDGSQEALGWDLNDTEWKINAQDTVNGEVKDINIVTIDRSGMSIAGDLKLSGYPKNIIVRYAQNDSDKDYPKPLYNFTAVSFPSAQIDKTWYYGKYIKIEENYVLIFKENFEQYSITVGTTEAYNREVNSKVWSTETPKRDDGYYIWQWTHTEIYSFDGGKWTEQDDDKIVCITGAKGEPGKKGDTGIAINNTKQWYILWPANDSTRPTPIPNNTEPDEPKTPSTLKEWMSTPPNAVNDHNVWTCYGSIFSDDTPENRHIKYSDPVKDNAYALAQGKTTNYYSPTEPINNIKKGDCWFDTGYVNIGALDNKTDYLGKFITSTTGNILVKQDKNDNTRYIPDTTGSTRLIKITPDNINKISITVGTTNAYETGNLKQWDGNKWKDIAGELVTNKVTANYINALDITAKKITVLDNNNVAQSDSNPILFEANGLSGTGSVKIANFTVKNDKLYSGKHDKIDSPNAGIYLGVDGLSIGSNFKVTAGSVEISDYTKSITKKYCIADFDVVPNPTPDWWGDWNNTNKWTTTPPRREDKKYIWEWTKEIKGNSTDDISTWEDKGKICITGAKGDTGPQGVQGETGPRGPQGEQGNPGTGISESKTYYSLSNKPNGPATGDSYIATTPAIDNWSESPQAFDKTKHQGYSYWTVERRVYTNNVKVWGTPVKASMLSVDFIDSLGITAEKITVRDSSQKVVFMADATSTTEGSNIKLGNFNVDKNSIKNGTLGSANSVIMSTGSEGSASIADSGSKSGWAFAAGTSFGVLKDGNLYASAGKIGGWTINSDKLSSSVSDESINSNITLKPNLLKFEGITTKKDFSTMQKTSFYLGIDPNKGNEGLGVFGSKMTRIFSRWADGGWASPIIAEVPGIIPFTSIYKYYEVPNLIIYATGKMTEGTYDINVGSWGNGVVKNIIGAVVMDTGGKASMGYKITQNNEYGHIVQVQGAKNYTFFALIFCYAATSGTGN